MQVALLSKKEELEKLNKSYNRLQKKYGAKELDSICNGGKIDNPDICFVFMNPTGRNIASLKSWTGIKAPWLGTKNIWKLFNKVGLMDDDMYNEIEEKSKNYGQEIITIAGNQSLFCSAMCIMDYIIKIPENFMNVCDCCTCIWAIYMYFSCAPAEIMNPMSSQKA